MNDLQTKLKALGACNEAIQSIDPKASPYRLYQTSQRGDWLLWLADRLGIDRKVVVFAACQVARTALIHVPPTELRPLKAIETAEAWTRGEATLAQVRSASASASASAYAASAYAADAAAYAAYAAADAASYAAAATHAAAAAAAATHAAAAAAAATHAAAAAYAATAARKEPLAKSAVIVRRHIPYRLFKEKLR